MLGKSLFNKKPTLKAGGDGGEAVKSVDTFSETMPGGPMPSGQGSGSSTSFSSGTPVTKSEIAEIEGGFAGVGGVCSGGSLEAPAVWYLADIPGRIQTGLTDDQKVLGPLTFSQLQQYATAGLIDRKKSLIWTEGMKDWIVSGRIENLFQSARPPRVPNKPLEKRGLLYRGFSILFSIVSFLAMIPLLIVKAGFYGVRTAYRRIGMPRLTLRTHWWMTLFVQVSFMIFAGLTMAFVDGPEEAWVVFLVWSILTAVGVHFLWATLLCRLWKKVPDKYRTESPESLLPLFFIPGVHIYAMYLAIPNLRFALNRTMVPNAIDNRFERILLAVSCFFCIIPGANLISAGVFACWLVSIRREVAFLSADVKKQSWAGESY